MAGGQNLATKYSPNVDERFTRESQISLALNNDYEFKGDKTVVAAVNKGKLAAYEIHNRIGG